MSETSDVVLPILKEFGAKPGILMERNNVGKAFGAGQVKAVIGLLEAILKSPAAAAFPLARKALAALKGLRPITFGVPGDPDIRGILAGGRAFYIECKQPGKKPEPHQANRRDVLVAMGAVYILARSVEDVYAGFAAHGIQIPRD